jgi:hypothetical protein
VHQNNEAVDCGSEEQEERGFGGGGITVEEGKTAITDLTLEIRTLLHRRQLTNIGNDIAMRNQHTLRQPTCPRRKIQQRNFIPRLPRRQPERNNLGGSLADPYQFRNRDEPRCVPLFNEEDPRFRDPDHPSGVSRGFEEGRMGKDEFGFGKVKLMDKFVSCVNGICARGNDTQT